MSWEKIKLGDCCSKIGSGSTPKGGSTVYIESGVSFIRSQNIYNLHFDYSGLAHITDEAAKKLNGVTIYEGDVLVNITGDSVARTCVVPTDVLPARVNQHVSIVRPDTTVLDYRFLNYYLASSYMQSFMLGLAVGKGASRNAMTKDMIANYEVPCPSLDTQHRISDILFAYDNLIENNQKQIKLLEEAAQRLYKEWFVDLHFPGYEDTEIVDGVPEGWKNMDINSIVTFHRGYDLTKSSFVEGKYPVIGSTSILGYHNQYKIEGPGIITGRSGSLGKYQLIQENYWPHNTTLYISDFKNHNILYVYSLLQTVDFTSLNNGGAIPTLNRNVLSNISVLETTKELQDMYSEFVTPLYQKIYTLKNLIDDLSVTRDRLLPKLMSGELEV